MEYNRFDLGSFEFGTVSPSEEKEGIRNDNTVSNEINLFCAERVWTRPGCTVNKLLDFRYTITCSVFAD